MLSLYNGIFKVESPARRLMQHLLSCFICYGETVHGTLLDRVVSMGESPSKRDCNSYIILLHSISCHCMYCCYLFNFIRFLFFTVCLLYVIVRMNMYVMFLLRQRRLNKLVIICFNRFLLLLDCMEYRRS